MPLINISDFIVVCAVCQTQSRRHLYIPDGAAICRLGFMTANIITHDLNADHLTSCYNILGGQVDSGLGTGHKINYC